MHITKVIIFVLIIVLMLPFASVKAQSFGFGCLGFVGGYGGYTYQKYDPKGLNNYVKAFNAANKDSLSSPMSEFGKAQGYRVGVNFFRADFQGFILTTKGFYQFLSEKKSASINVTNGSSSAIYEVEMKNWGVGIDLGTAITEALSWKVVDAAVLYNSASFTNTRNSPGPSTTLLQFNSEKSTIGYSIATGFILQLAGRYISLEGAAGYSAFKIDKMRLDDGTELAISETSKEVMTNFITAGGFSAVIQLNIGFPL